MTRKDATAFQADLLDKDLALVDSRSAPEDEYGTNVSTPYLRKLLHTFGSEEEIDGRDYTALFMGNDGHKVDYRDHAPHPMPAFSDGRSSWIVDADVDSDNNNGFSAPRRTETEDAMEDDASKPGKIIGVNDSDKDGDGLLDFGDGFGDNVNAKERFVPLVLQIPANVDPAVAQVKVTYSASVPATPTPAPGHLRLWTKDGNVQRNPASVANSGDFIPSGTFTANQLGFSTETHIRLFYLEGIAVSATKGDQRILFEIDPDGDGTNFVATDVVRVSVVKVAIAPHSADVCEVDANNLVTSYSAAGENAVVKATITPSDVDASALLMWTGGLPGDTPDKRKVKRDHPSKEALKVLCAGVTEDTTDVWVVRVNLDISGVSDAEEDTQDAKIRINSDDDNCSGVADKDDTGAVQGENDLVSIALIVEPEGLGGTLQLDTTQCPKLAIYGGNDRSSPNPDNLVWNLGSGSAPSVLWVEGRELSAATGDQVLKLKYNWCQNMEDTVKATVTPHHGDSEATLRLCKADRDSHGHETVGAEKYAPIGGRMFAVLEIKVGPGERVDPSVNNVTVRVREDSELHADPDNQEDLATFDLTTDQGWEKNTNPCNANASWVGLNAGESPKAENTGASPVLYRARVIWQTTTIPLGHNGPHTLSLAAVNGNSAVTEITFQRHNQGEWESYTNGPQDALAVVKNLVVTNVATSNGTQDYLKYDPNPEAEDSLHRPSVSFSVEDADPHEYGLVVYLRKTGHGDWSQSDPYMWTRAYGPGQFTLTWDGAQTPGGEPDTCERGTYTFDVYAREYENVDLPPAQRVQLDRNAFKTPYCLWIPDRVVIGGQERAGHEVWQHLPEEEDEEAQLRAAYYLNDQGRTNASYVEIIPMDPGFEEKRSVSGPIEQGVLHEGVDEDGDGEKDGIRVYTFAKEDAGGDWRVLFTALDGDTADERRTHDNARMLAANQQSDEPTHYTMAFKTDYYPDKYTTASSQRFHVETGAPPQVYPSSWGFPLPCFDPDQGRTGTHVYPCTDIPNSQKRYGYHWQPKSKDACARFGRQGGVKYVNGTWDHAQHALIKTTKENHQTALFTYLGHGGDKLLSGSPLPVLCFYGGGHWQGLAAGVMQGVPEDGLPHPLPPPNTDQQIVYHYHLEKDGTTDAFRHLRLALLLGCNTDASYDGKSLWGTLTSRPPDSQAAVVTTKNLVYGKAVAAFACYFWALVTEDWSNDKRTSHLVPRENRDQRWKYKQALGEAHDYINAKAEGRFREISPLTGKAYSDVPWELRGVDNYLPKVVGR